MGFQGAQLAAEFERLYQLRGRAEVVAFVAEHPFLTPLLAEAYRQIESYFPQSQAFLEVVADKEAPDDRELVASVVTGLSPAEALPTLDRFDEGWWLDASGRAQGKLCITLEFR